ncbi:ferric uptake regulator, Fur family [Gracilinema caldarium DSM 7334]|uniref:Ferric uptake regulator, Fur family n=2 Tax=Gracilinema caldarium TaxID=215591 RepID=F8EYX0_GRAC1|nr:ferric uptake regulator, Fur family [Gracilinema caldarium DSM 7334]
MTRFKRSRQRERILSLLHSTKSHPTAAWIYESLKPEMPDLSLGTVYRNLKILEIQGKLQVLHSGSGFDRFDGDTKPHYHLICTQCGAVEDVDLPVQAELEQKAKDLLGQRISGHRLDFFGLCDHCFRKSLDKV